MIVDSENYGYAIYQPILKSLPVKIFKSFHIISDGKMAMRFSAKNTVIILASNTTGGAFISDEYCDY